MHHQRTSPGPSARQRRGALFGGRLAAVQRLVAARGCWRVDPPAPTPARRRRRGRLDGKNAARYAAGRASGNLAGLARRWVTGGSDQAPRCEEPALLCLELGRPSSLADACVERPPRPNLIMGLIEPSLRAGGGRGKPIAPIATSTTTHVALSPPMLGFARVRRDAPVEHGLADLR